MAGVLCVDLKYGREGNTYRGMDGDGKSDRRSKVYSFNERIPSVRDELRMIVSLMTLLEYDLDMQIQTC